MKIYTTLQIGEYHTLHCEDYLFTAEMGDKLICAVMDGCTMGTDSYFISTLIGKLLRKIVKEQSYKELYTPNNQIFSLEDYLKLILKHLFIELKTIKNHLLLEKSEMLSTLIILIINKNTQEGIVLVLGDGFVNINGRHTDFDHEDKPDYIGFHISDDFDSWYSSQTQKITFQHIEDISIATDGIFMLSKISESISDEAINPIELLITDTTDCENSDMLNIKIKKMARQFGIKPTDDLALIRIRQ